MLVDIRLNLYYVAAEKLFPSSPPRRINHRVFWSGETDSLNLKYMFPRSSVGRVPMKSGLTIKTGE